MTGNPHFRGPLAGLRVVDLTWMVAGPFTTWLLANLGAEVIKIESAGRLDATRRLTAGLPMPPGDIDSSPYFAQLNNNKLGVTLNLKSDEGIALAKRLVAASDIVVEGFRGGVIQRLGIRYEELSRDHPDLVMLSLSTNGSTGPDSAQPGYAPVFAAASGLAARTGYADGPPTELRVSADVRVGYAAALAVLAAVYRRRRTGKGAYLDFSATEAITSLGGEGLLEYQLTGVAPTRRGNDEPGAAPHDCYRCAGDDAWVAIAVTSDDQWRALCKCVGMDELADDDRFATRGPRSTNREQLRAPIERWTVRHSAAEITEQLQAAGVAVAPSATYRDLLADEHLRQRGLFGRVPHSLIPGGAVVVGVPWRTEPESRQALLPAPRLGEHNDYVYGQLLGLSADERAALAERNFSRWMRPVGV